MIFILQVCVLYGVSIFSLFQRLFDWILELFWWCGNFFIYLFACFRFAFFLAVVGFCCVVFFCYCFYPYLLKNEEEIKWLKYLVAMEVHFKAMEKIIVIMLLVHNQISILIFCIISKGHKFLLLIKQQTCWCLHWRKGPSTSIPCVITMNVQRIRFELASHWERISWICRTKI